MAHLSYLYRKAHAYKGKPVGVSLRDGTGVSGVLVGATHRNIYVTQYLYGSQFATFHYTYWQIRNIYKFPGY